MGHRISTSPEPYLPIRASKPKFNPDRGGGPAALYYMRERREKPMLTAPAKPVDRGVVVGLVVVFFRGSQASPAAPKDCLFMD